MLKNTINGIEFVNPTGGFVRYDKGGDGHHGAPRGSRTHNGVDFQCRPGQDILMPVKGKIVRLSYPYKYDTGWKGLHIYSNKIELKMWYLTPLYNHIGQYFEAGDCIGAAQDISKLYKDVKPHIHMRIVKIDPLLLFNVK